MFPVSLAIENACWALIPVLIHLVARIPSAGNNDKAVFQVPIDFPTASGLPISAPTNGPSKEKDRSINSMVIKKIVGENNIHGNPFVNEQHGLVF